MGLVWGTRSTTTLVPWSGQQLYSSRDLTEILAFYLLPENTYSI